MAVPVAMPVPGKGGPPAITGFTTDPDTMKSVPTGKINFLPFHIEGRLSYWIGHGALGKKGVRPYVFAGGGMAQVDAKVAVTVSDCSSPMLNGQPPMSPQCEQGSTTINPSSLQQRKIDAWKKLGQGFAEIGGGIVYAFKEQIGVQANLNLMYMLGSSGPVLEPSLGVVYGL